MEAKEMFKELGLEPIKNQPENMLWYSSTMSTNGMYRVRFYLLFKVYDVVEYGTVGDRVPLDLHKAIHKQIEEQEWLDDE